MPLKVIGAGLGRTGTLSLKIAWSSSASDAAITCRRRARHLASWLIGRPRRAAICRTGGPCSRRSAAASTGPRPATGARSRRAILRPRLCCRCGPSRAGSGACRRRSPRCCGATARCRPASFATRWRWPTPSSRRRPSVAVSTTRSTCSPSTGPQRRGPPDDRAGSSARLRRRRGLGAPVRVPRGAGTRHAIPAANSTQEFQERVAAAGRA